MHLASAALAANVDVAAEAERLARVKHDAEDAESDAEDHAEDHIVGRAEGHAEEADQMQVQPAKKSSRKSIARGKKASRPAPTPHTVQDLGSATQAVMSSRPIQDPGPSAEAARQSTSSCGLALPDEHDSDDSENWHQNKSADWQFFLKTMDVPLDLSGDSGGSSAGPSLSVNPLPFNTIDGPAFPAFADQRNPLDVQVAMQPFATAPPFDTSGSFGRSVPVWTPSSQPMPAMGFNPFNDTTTAMNTSFAPPIPSAPIQNTAPNNWFTPMVPPVDPQEILPVPVPDDVGANGQLAKPTDTAGAGAGNNNSMAGVAHNIPTGPIGVLEYPDANSRVTMPTDAAAVVEDAHTPANPDNTIAHVAQSIPPGPTHTHVLEDANANSGIAMPTDAAAAATVSGDARPDTQIAEPTRTSTRAASKRAGANKAGGKVNAVSDETEVTVDPVPVPGKNSKKKSVATTGDTKSARKRKAAIVADENGKTDARNVSGEQLDQCSVVERKKRRTKEKADDTGDKTSSNIVAPLGRNALNTMQVDSTEPVHSTRRSNRLRQGECA